MRAGSFFDTNVLVYFALPGGAHADRADALIAEGGTISVQVLNELANVARHKMRMSWAETSEALHLVRSLLEVEPVTLEVHALGLSLAERYGFHVYDAMIVAAALEAGCTTLWSEDMQHGQQIAGQLTIRNPFKAL